MFGTITLNYSSPLAESSEADLTMSFSAEADLKDALRHFGNFLRAMEYPLDPGDSLVVSYAKDNDCPEVSSLNMFNDPGIAWMSTSQDNMSFLS